MSRLLGQNNVHFHATREKLKKWADDMVLSAEKALADTKEQIKALRRQARQAVTLEEQHAIQQQSQRQEKQQRRQRQDIFKAEDEIMQKRDSLILLDAFAPCKQPWPKVSYGRQQTLQSDEAVACTSRL